MVSIGRTTRRSKSGPFSRTRLLILLSAVVGVVCLTQFLYDGGGNFGLLEESMTSGTPTLQSRLDSLECRFYLAESAIPMGGLGIYTAIDIQKGQEAQSMSDICVYVADTPEDTDFETHSWARDVFFGQFEGDNPRAACEGFATLFNSMPNGVRTSELKSMRMQTNAGLDRKNDPGAGASSHFYGVTSLAVRDVARGSELTIDYGDFPYDEDKEYKAPVRTVEWLRTHGVCIDNIQIKQATDRSMGRGAFSKRPMSKGQVVAPAPLQMYKNRADFGNQAPEALFVNYNFQAAGSDMMMFPYGPGVNLINHDHQSPNVFIQWSTNHMHHSQWTSLSATDMFNMVWPGALMLEVVALRDIGPNEELFMDYGDAWEDAWKAHLKNWVPVPDPQKYVYPGDMDLSQPFRTVDEQKDEPYPENLLSVCSTGNWDRDAGTTTKWKPNKFDFPEGLVHCHILKREMIKGKEFYTVSLDFDGDRAYDANVPVKERYLDKLVPKSAITFADKPYSSDLHLPNAFRHPIGFPDHLFPEQWRSSSSRAV